MRQPEHPPPPRAPGPGLKYILYLWAPAGASDSSPRSDGGGREALPSLRAAVRSRPLTRGLCRGMAWASPQGARCPCEMGISPHPLQPHALRPVLTAPLSGAISLQFALVFSFLKSYFNDPYWPKSPSDTFPPTSLLLPHSPLSHQQETPAHPSGPPWGPPFCPDSVIAPSLRSLAVCPHSLLFCRQSPSRGLFYFRTMYPLKRLLQAQL